MGPTLRWPLSWAERSLAVLMEVYAACLYGQDVIAKRRIQEALGH